MDHLVHVQEYDKSSIFEIYRACRLCGAGAGYKMPIIQKIIDIDGDEIDLQKQIGECLDIEVSINDRMPPLICELCADNVNNFYDFRKMCQLTDKRTRMRLGLTLRTAREDSLENNNCIPGVAEPVCANSDSEEEPLSRHRPQSSESKDGPEAKKLRETYQVSSKCRVFYKSDDSVPPESEPRPRDTRAREARAGRRTRSAERRARLSEGSDDAAGTPQTDGEAMSIPRQLKRPREDDVTMETPPPPAKIFNKASEIMTPNGETILKSHKKTIESRKHKKTGRAVENKPANTTYQNTADRRNLCKEENLLPAINQDRTVETTDVKEGATERESLEHKQIGLSYVCDSCQYCSVSKELLERHMRFHDDRRPFHCGTCGFRFLSKVTLNTHKIIHGINLNNIKIHECNICSYKTPHSTDLKGHLLIHAGKRPYSCDMCNKRFRKARHLKSHQRTHTGEKPYKCRTCEKRFTQAGSLITHQRTHTGDKPYKCETCEKRFTKAGNLKKHERTHTGEKPYKCSTCEKEFTEAGNLKRHQIMHTGEKPFKCESCKKRFTEAGHLKTHQRTHTGEKPYKCEKCEKRFTQASYLIIHERTHTGEKPYKCSTCEKRFTDSGYLKTHQRTHTGEKPYICNICEYRSGDRSALRRHLITHIGRTVGSE